jgi:hypothetical protein
MNHCVCLGLMILLDNKQLRFWRNLTLTQAWKRDMLHSSLAILSIRLGRTRRTSYPWRNPAFLLVFRVFQGMYYSTCITFFFQGFHHLSLHGL